MFDNPYNATPEEISAAEERMRSWPSLEKTEGVVATVVQQIADAAAAIAPTLRWESVDARSQGGCRVPYAKTAGVSVFLPDMVSDTPIPDADWPAVLQVARRIAAENGITEIEVRVDKPGDHDVRLYTEDGNEIHLATSKAALISGQTGCRYLQSDLANPTR